MMDLPEETDDLSMMLLRDIKAVFDTIKVDRIFSADLVEQLNGMEDRPWPDLRRGNGLTQASMARYLRPFNISPKQIKIGVKGKRGFILSAFQDAFNRYIPTEGGAQGETMKQSNNNSDLNQKK